MSDIVRVFGIIGLPPAREFDVQFAVPVFRMVVGDGIPPREETQHQVAVDTRRVRAKLETVGPETKALQRHHLRAIELPFFKQGRQMQARLIDEGALAAEIVGAGARRCVLTRLTRKS
jgi:hypothetical protein